MRSRGFEVLIERLMKITVAVELRILIVKVVVT